MTDGWGLSVVKEVFVQNCVIYERRPCFLLLASFDSAVGRGCSCNSNTMSEVQHGDMILHIYLGPCLALVRENESIAIGPCDASVLSLLLAHG